MRKSPLKHCYFCARFSFPLKYFYFWWEEVGSKWQTTAKTVQISLRKTNLSSFPMWSVYSALERAVFASGLEQCIIFESICPFFQVSNTSHSALVRHLNGGSSLLFIKYLKLFLSSFSTHFLQIFHKNTAKKLHCQVWAYLNKECRSQTFCKKGNGLWTGSLYSFHTCSLFTLYQLLKPTSNNLIIRFHLFQPSSLRRDHSFPQGGRTQS